MKKKEYLYAKKLSKMKKKITLLRADKIKNSDFTINIIKHLKKKMKKDHHLFFIIGADNLINFHKWNNY